MTITLYSNSSVHNKVDKQLTQITQLTGILRDESEIESPVFTVAGDLATILQANYFFISEFSRYYYMEKAPRVIRNGLYEITGAEDVLMSFKSQIRANGAIIKKQTYKNNTLLNDGTFKVYQNREIQTFQFPHSFSGTTYLLMIMG